MRYGIKCTSTMCGVTFYIIDDSKEKCEDAFDNFKRFLNEEPNDWEAYCEENEIYNYDDLGYTFSVGKTEKGTFMMVTDLGCGLHEEDRAFEFEIIRYYKDRF